MKLSDFVSMSKNHKKVIRELNENLFGGNESTENAFMSNIDEHIKETIVVYKSMMTLFLNLLNPQNITYMLTISSVDSFNIFLGMIIRLQLSIAYVLCWYYTTQKIDKEKALAGYKDFLLMWQYIDLLCNQAGDLLSISYMKFIDQNFGLILWMGMYFKRNHPELFPNIDTLIHRCINQVYAIDMSIETSDNSSSPSEKNVSGRNQKPLIWYDEEELDEIDDQLSSFDLVNMVKPRRDRTPDVYEVSLLVDLLVNNENYQRLLHKSSTALNKAYNKCSNLKTFWGKVGKLLIVIKMRLEQSYFESKHHNNMRNYIRSGILKGFIRELPQDLLNPIEDICFCYCSDSQQKTACWENGFHILANYAFFIHENIHHATTFPNYPYISPTPTQLETAKGSDCLDDKAIQHRRDLLELDIFFNPSCYQTYIMYGFLNAYTFSRVSETAFVKGQKSASVHKDSSDFDLILNCMANALSIIVSNLTHTHDLSPKDVKTNYGIDVFSKEWIQRAEKLNRWSDSTIYTNLYEVFLILFRSIHM